MSPRCCVDGCLKPAGKRLLYCWGHQKRRQRGCDVSAPLREYGVPSWQKLKQVALAYADADTDDDDAYRRASRHLLQLVYEYVKDSKKQANRLSGRPVLNVQHGREATSQGPGK